MKFLGVDLAWTQNNESGLIALERDGSISDAGWAVGTAETLSWITARAGADTLIFVDAPLIVTNPAGTQRLCENHASKRYGRWKAGANSTNLGKPERLAGVDLRVSLERLGFRYDDGLDGPPVGGRVVSECYPYTTLVGAHELGYVLERPAYKRKPALGHADCVPPPTCSDVRRVDRASRVATRCRPADRHHLPPDDEAASP